MTTASPPTADATDPSGPSDEAAPAGAASDEGGRRPPGRRRVRSRWWRFGYPVALLVLLAAIPLLVWAGLRAILDSTDGQLVKRVTDPAAPGYEAVLEPTPTDLVVAVGPGGSLDSILVVALTSDGAGGVLSVPAGTVVPLPGGQVSLRWIYDELGPEALRTSLGELLDLTFTDAQVVASTEWARLVGPAAPITVDSPDPVPGADGEERFPRGEVELGPQDVWPYISGQGASESDLNRLVRVQAFWRGWLAAIGEAGAGAVPPPADVGLGRFLATLGPARVQFETLPVTEITPDAAGNEQFEAAPDALADAVAAIVPFPEGAPGGRPRVRMLDGTGVLDNGVAAAIRLAAAGAQIDVVGNARSFGQETTQLVYYDPAFAEAAERFRDALGVGEVVHSEQTNAATDLTVVLGEDYVGRTRGAVASPSTMEGQGG